ncbi:type III secretion system export apparatus subunit SctR [Vibrio sp. S4M6]|uniref:type III secretion system export apparatus subunit SctR n=1 Tax=Vibrio sinus TaxID=2946865 RepID=UPI00202A5814|nr:type III secretion system export apparatus subunit SctR [Vibrio sinus]MCL9783721.1 type III secretion system export apparatus subunit SctR [Vibrio sinus]
MSSLLDHPFQLIIFLFSLSVLPLFAVMATSFLKLSVVFSLLRNALGIQQIPPNMAIYGLALILTMFIMAPVGLKIKDNLQHTPISLTSDKFYQQIDQGALEPYRVFLKRHTDPKQIHFFSEVGHRLWPKQYQKKLDDGSLLVMIPAFTVSQLIEAFKIGLLLFLPFVAIDLIVSNILLAMGMMMVSPMTISLPFKLLIFVLMGGWEKLLTQLMLSYS